MKKVEKVSIANISFTLDNDAYMSLKQYLDSLHNYYRTDRDGPEIIADIEARIAELILNEQVYTKSVTLTIIDTIIAQLGSPEEIDDDTPAFGADRPGTETSDDNGAGSAGTEETFGTPVFEPSIPRRLHRSREGRILGGVCSGIARFWNINVAWVRLVFLAPIILPIITSIISSAPGAHSILRIPGHPHWLGLHGVDDLFGSWAGAFFILYFVLWIVLPMARTPRQKLEARGKKITPATIRQNLQSSVSTPSGRKAASVLAEVINVFGRIVLFFLKFVATMVGFSLLLGAMGCFVAMLIIIFNTNHVDAPWQLWDGIRILGPVWFTELILLCVSLPLMIAGMGLFSFVFNWRLGRRWFYLPTLGLWMLAMLLCTMVVASNARFLHDELPQRFEEWEERGIDFDDDMIWERKIHDHDDGGRNRIEIRRTDGGASASPDSPTAPETPEISSGETPVAPEPSTPSVAPESRVMPESSAAPGTSDSN